jgi:hypothetical protein
LLPFCVTPFHAAHHRTGSSTGGRSRTGVIVGNLASDRADGSASGGAFDPFSALTGGGVAAGVV